jgi:hypothetical protein
MATTSTAALIQQVRTKLLNFAPAGGGQTLTTRLGGRLYIGQAPENPAFPHGVMRFINTVKGGAYNGDRVSGDIELMLYGNTVAQAQSLEDAADVAEQALLRYKDATGGLVFSRESIRDSVSPPSDPAMAAFISVRCLFAVKAWPTYITQYATT